MMVNRNEYQEASQTKIKTFQCPLCFKNISFFMYQIYYTSRVQYSYIHGTVQNWADLLCTASQVVISFCRVALWNRIHK